jgi:hypothetical protein
MFFGKWNGNIPDIKFQGQKPHCQLISRPIFRLSSYTNARNELFQNLSKSARSKNTILYIELKNGNRVAGYFDLNSSVSLDQKVNDIYLETELIIEKGTNKILGEMKLSKGIWISQRDILSIRIINIPQQEE